MSRKSPQSRRLKLATLPYNWVSLRQEKTYSIPRSCPCTSRGPREQPTAYLGSQNVCNQHRTHHRNATNLSGIKFYTCMLQGQVCQRASTIENTTSPSGHSMQQIESTSFQTDNKYIGERGAIAMCRRQGAAGESTTITYK